MKKNKLLVTQKNKKLNLLKYSHFKMIFLSLLFIGVFFIGLTNAGSVGDTIEYDGYEYICYGAFAAHCGNSAYHPNDQEKDSYAQTGFWKIVWKKGDKISDGESENKDESKQSTPDETQTDSESETNSNDEGTDDSNQQGTNTDTVDNDDSTNDDGSTSTPIPIESDQDYVKISPDKPVIAWMPSKYPLNSGFTINWNMWWGITGNNIKLFENGIEIDSKTLQNDPNKKQAQSGSFDVTTSKIGDFTYQIKLCNKFGNIESCSKSSEKFIYVVDLNTPTNISDSNSENSDTEDITQTFENQQPDVIYEPILEDRNIMELEENSNSDNSSEASEDEPVDEHLDIENNNDSDETPDKNQGVPTGEEIIEITEKAKDEQEKEKNVLEPSKPTFGFIPTEIEGLEFEIEWNMWWGTNGNLAKFYLNNKLISSHDLVINSPNMQSTKFTYVVKEHGDYNIRVELCNSEGELEKCSSSNKQILSYVEEKSIFDIFIPDELEEIKDDNIIKPSIPEFYWTPNLIEGKELILGWHNDGEVSANSWILYENGISIYSNTLLETENKEQFGVVKLTNREFKQYNFEVELCKDGICVKSENKQVSFTKSKSFLAKTADSATSLIVAEADEDDVEKTIEGSAKIIPIIEVDFNSDKVVAGYFVEWGIYGRNYQPSDIPFEKMTHVLFAFIDITEDGSIKIADYFATEDKGYAGDCWEDDCKRGIFNQFDYYSQMYPHITFSISIGGWSYSEYFNSLKNDIKRKKFVDSSIKFLEDYPAFTGLDIDWEFPNQNGAGNTHGPEDKETFTLLMKDLREALDKLSTNTGKTYELTAAVGTNPNALEWVDYNEVDKYMDYIFLMSYDYNGAWNKYTGHNSPLFNNGDPKNIGYNINYAVEYLQSQGVPTNKIVPGGSFYGRTWGGVSNTENPLWAQSTSKGLQSWEPGSVDFKYADDLRVSGEYKYYYDEIAVASYLYDGNGFISYDSEEVMEKKALYSVQNNLGGIFFWELSSDNGKLMDAIHKGFDLDPNTPLQNEEKMIEQSEKQILPNFVGGSGEIIITDVGTGEEIINNLIVQPPVGINGDLTKRVINSAKTLGKTPTVDLVNIENNYENVRRVLRLFPEDKWDVFFPIRDLIYTYENFLLSVALFPKFCNESGGGLSLDDACKKELATSFAHFNQETGAHSSAGSTIWDQRINQNINMPEEWRQGLYWLRENNGNAGGYLTHCGSNNMWDSAWPCGEGEKYYGRGPKQLSYMYNYGPFSKMIFGDETALLNNPDRVASEGYLALASGLWFSMIPQSPKPSIHEVVTGLWKPNELDVNAGMASSGFGVTINIINGGLECRGSEMAVTAKNRVKYYKEFASKLGVDYSEDEINNVLGCTGMSDFNSGGAGSIPIYYNPWSGKCELMETQSPFWIFFEDGYEDCMNYYSDNNFNLQANNIPFDNKKPTQIKLNSSEELIEDLSEMNKTIKKNLSEEYNLPILGDVEPLKIGEGLNVGYLHMWNAPVPYIKLSEVPDFYNVIDVSFGIEYINGDDYKIVIAEFSGSKSDSGYAPQLSEIRAEQKKGKKIILSLGGAEGHFSIKTRVDAENFAKALTDKLVMYEYDGVDIDFEGVSVAGCDADDVIFGVKKALIDSGNSLGKEMMLTMAPETLYIDTNANGNSFYKDLIKGLKNEITFINPQIYNAGGIWLSDKDAAILNNENPGGFGWSGKGYSQGTTMFAKYYVGELLKQGLTHKQIVLGFPSIPSAAPAGGFVEKNIREEIYDFYKSQGTPIGGFMTWSINWDMSNNYTFGKENQEIFN